MRQPHAELQWRKSNRCVDPNGDCIEVASDGDAVYLRDSTERDQVLTVAVEAWRVFADAVRDGEFDSP
jgi:Domain of unknown function (DUF397)